MIILKIISLIGMGLLVYLAYMTVSGKKYETHVREWEDKHKPRYKKSKWYKFIYGDL